jgi:thiamine-phosphate pyrophosphorylase
VTPVVCAITDRRRLQSASVEAVVRHVAHAVHAGVDLVQIRERDLEARTLCGLVAACVETARGSVTRVVVNDRADVAMAAGAHGVHLRGDSVVPARLRRIAPRGFLIGRSVHSLADVEPPAVEGADYLVFGPVFETGSKPGVAPAGAAALAAVVSATPLPVLAVGGLTVATAAEVARTGAAGLAAIGLFMDAADEKAVQHTVTQLRKAFDTAARRS